MPGKKRFFKNTKKAVGNKSVIVREKKAPIAVQAQKATETASVLPVFPKIPQTITEKPRQLLSMISSWKGKPGSFWAVMAGIVCIVLVSLVGCVMLGRELFDFAHTASKRMALQQEMRLWEDISKKYPSYRDANFQVAVLAYRLGDRQKEREFLEKTLAIDPNFKPAKRLEE